MGRRRGGTRLGAGDFSFVNPDEEHVETTLDETLFMIIKAEPNIQYEIDTNGDRK